MFANLCSFVKGHHVYYEVLPYYVLLEERDRSGPPTTRRGQAGFDVEIYGVNTNDETAASRSNRVYSSSYAELQKMAEMVSYHTNSACHLEVIPFVLDSRNRAKVERMFRIRISRYRDVDHPSCVPEQQALEELENELHALGVGRQ